MVCYPPVRRWKSGSHAKWTSVLTTPPSRSKSPPELVEAMTVQDSMEAYYEEMTKGEEVHCVGTRTRKRIRCVICMNSKFTKIKLPCGHIFHRKCIDEWARWKPKCPVCDATLQLVPDKEDTSSSSTV